MSSALLGTRPETAEVAHACGAGRNPCPRPAYIEVTSVCVHEHIHRGWLCQAHYLKARLICRACLEHPTNAHKCDVSIRAVGEASA